MTIRRSSPEQLDEEYFPRWCAILGALGLDIARGCFEHLGLVGCDEDAVRELIRRETEKARGATTDDRSAVIGFVQGCFEGIERLHGPDYLAYFQDWGDQVYRYDPPSGAQVLFWSSIILRGKGGARLPLLAQMVRKEHERLPLHDLVRSPESDWDREYYRQHDYPLSGDAAPPVHELSVTMHHVRFLRAWEAAIRLVPDLEAELDEIARWGIPAGERLGIESDMLEPPGSWPKLPRPPEPSTEPA